MNPSKETLRTRWQRRGLDTHVSLPLFALLLLVAIWVVTFHEIDAERAHARDAAADSLQEMLGTYEAQVARSIDGIDQTLRMLKYAVERKGTLGALPELGRQGLLPPGVVFVVSIVDQNGMTVASHPRALSRRASASNTFPRLPIGRSRGCLAFRFSRSGYRPSPSRRAPP